MLKLKAKARREGTLKCMADNSTIIEARVSGGGAHLYERSRMPCSVVSIEERNNSNAR